MVDSPPPPPSRVHSPRITVSVCHRKLSVCVCGAWGGGGAPKQNETSVKIGVFGNDVGHAGPSFVWKKIISEIKFC